MTQTHTHKDITTDTHMHAWQQKPFKTFAYFNSKKTTNK